MRVAIGSANIKPHSHAHYIVTEKSILKDEIASYKNASPHFGGVRCAEMDALGNQGPTFNPTCVTGQTDEVTNSELRNVIKTVMAIGGKSVWCLLGKDM